MMYPGLNLVHQNSRSGHQEAERDSSRRSNLILAQEWKRKLLTLSVEIFHSLPSFFSVFLMLQLPGNRVAIVAEADNWSL